MIVGSGLMAKAFEREFSQDRRIVIFASGVSNSNETDSAAFAREEMLLNRILSEQAGHVVYFSTCSVLDPERRRAPYVDHKLNMERIVARTERGSIFRLPQIGGVTSNPHTLLNFLHSRISSGTPFAVWKNAWRNVLDVDDAAAIGTHLIRQAVRPVGPTNIANPRAVQVIDLVGMFERVLGVRARFEEIDRGDHYDIDVVHAMESARELGIEFGVHYIESVIEKYYGHKLA
jgi:nucleoside-diphosphate-sugar epimerase